MGDICINIHIQCTFASPFPTTGGDAPLRQTCGQREVPHVFVKHGAQDMSVCFYYACHLPSHHIKESTKGDGRRQRLPPLVTPAEGRLLHMVAAEVGSIAKTYRRIRKCALNMYIDAYISHIPLESLSSQSSHTQVQACPLS